MTPLRAGGNHLMAGGVVAGIAEANPQPGADTKSQRHRQGRMNQRGSDQAETQDDATGHRHKPRAEFVLASPREDHHPGKTNRGHSEREGGVRLGPMPIVDQRLEDDPPGVQDAEDQVNGQGGNDHRPAVGDKRSFCVHLWLLCEVCLNCQSLFLRQNVESLFFEDVSGLGGILRLR